MLDVIIALKSVCEDGGDFSENKESEQSVKMQKKVNGNDALNFHRSSFVQAVGGRGHLERVKERELPRGDRYTLLPNIFCGGTKK